MMHAVFPAGMISLQSRMRKVLNFRYLWITLQDPHFNSRELCLLDDISSFIKAIYSDSG